jgi:hypothetical protein
MKRAFSIPGLLGRFGPGKNFISRELKECHCSFIWDNRLSEELDPITDVLEICNIASFRRKVTERKTVYAVIVPTSHAGCICESQGMR